MCFARLVGKKCFSNWKILSIVFSMEEQTLATQIYEIQKLLEFCLHGIDLGFDRNDF